jgi:hypothetical protein
MPQTAKMVEVVFARVDDGVEAEGVGGNVMIEVVSYNGRFVEGDEGVPRFRGESEVEDVGQGER